MPRSRPHCAARPPRWRRRPQLAQGLDLHRQAEDARPRGGRLRRRAVRARRGPARPARNTLKMGIMDEERRTTVNLQRVYPRRAATAWSSSTPASSTAPATRSIPSMEAGPMIRKGDIKSAAVDCRPTSDNNVLSGSPAGCAGARRSARACGPCPTRWRRCSSRRSRIRRPAPTPPGYPRRRRPRCTRCTTTRSTCAERQAAALRGRARDLARRNPDAAARSARATGARPRSQPSSRTMRRASSATSCAGSTRASAARRCRTSTTSA